MLFKKIKAIIKFCRLGDMLLVVPYSGAAAFLASDGAPELLKLVCLILAVISGHALGNAFNSVMDKDIDAINPRTQDRPLVKKELSKKQAIAIIAVCFLILIGATALINPFYVLLLPIPAAVTLGYSVCKRISWLGHVVLGIAHAVCPVGGWIVFSGSFTDPRAVAFGAFVFFWTVSVDMLYSMQDLEYDKKMGARTIPVVFGKKVTYAVSVISHILSELVLVLCILVMDCSLPFMIISAAAELLLITQYALIIKDEKNARHAFNFNQSFSVLIFIASIFN